MAITATASQLGAQQAISSASGAQATALAGAQVNTIAEQTAVGVSGITENGEIAAWQAVSNTGNKASQASSQMLQGGTQ